MFDTAAVSGLPRGWNTAKKTAAGNETVAGSLRPSTIRASVRPVASLVEDQRRSPDKIIENVVGGEIGDDGGPEEPPSQASCPGLASQTTRPAHADTRHGSRLIKASSVPIN